MFAPGRRNEQCVQVCSTDENPGRLVRKEIVRGYFATLIFIDIGLAKIAWLGATLGEVLNTLLDGRSSLIPTPMHLRVARSSLVLLPGPSSVG